MKIVIASKNAHKIKEISDKFSHFDDIEISSLNSIEEMPDVEETGTTFSENALIKARAISKLTSLPVMADDSGLVIDALGGEPGIFSARYGNLKDDQAKNLLVLSKMEDIPDEKRSAYFISVIALVMPDGAEYLVEGKCHGVITRSVMGNKGFGYDPIFFIPELNKTFAEIPLSEKNKISHRAIALNNFFDTFSKIRENKNV